MIEKPHGPTLQEAQATTAENHDRKGWRVGRWAAEARLDVLTAALEELVIEWRVNAHVETNDRDPGWVGAEATWKACANNVADLLAALRTPEAARAHVEEANMKSPETRVAAALDLAVQYGGTDGSHHKAWVIDQMVRVLCESPDSYRALVREAKAGDDGPDTYDWDEGVAP